MVREAVEVINRCDDLVSEDSPLLINGGCASGISFRVCFDLIYHSQNVKPHNHDRIFINSGICGELLSSTDSIPSYPLSEELLVRVVSQRQVSKRSLFDL